MMVTKMLVLVLLSSGMVTCRDTSPDLASAVIQYSDTCEYSDYYDRCGDRCTDSWRYCYCGNTTINFSEDAQHQCCVPAEDSQGRKGVEGEVTEDRQCTKYGLVSSVLKVK